VESENGEITYEPFNDLGTNDPVTCARDHDLAEIRRWRRVKQQTMQQEKLLCMANQANLHSFHTSWHLKYGFYVPNNYDHTVVLDRLNGNTK